MRFEFQREAKRDDFYIFGRGCGITKDGQLADFPCAEAWGCISCYVYAGLQGGCLMSLICCHCIFGMNFGGA